MLFCDPIFILFFSAYFVLHRLVSKKLMMLLVVLGSLFFYGYWNSSYIPMPILMVVFSFWAGFQIDATKNKTKQRKILFCLLATLFLPLIFFKYLNFFSANLRLLIPQLHTKTINNPLPLGISFITFTLAAYLIDIYRGKFKVERDIWALLSSVLFFPHLIAGPIVRPSQLIPQLKRWNPAVSSKLLFGSLLFSVGLFKKLVLADTIAQLVNHAYSNLNSSNSVWPYLMAFYGFAVQIFCDFSGYTDMALGISWALGIRLPTNFKQPYISTSLIDFWRRWHITLSFWLRDYLYIALGGNRTTYVGQLRNILITMILGGLWHGANWTFVAWGFLHGLGLAINHTKRRLLPHLKIPGCVSWVITFHFVAFGWVFFRAPDFKSAIRILDGVIDKSWNLSSFPRDYFFSIGVLIVFAITHRWDKHSIYRLASSRMWKPVLYLLIFIITLTSFLFSSGSPADFIYFDF